MQIEDCQKIELIDQFKKKMLCFLGLDVRAVTGYRDELIVGNFIVSCENTAKSFVVRDSPIIIRNIRNISC